jgi:glycosyltransferase involved in cell wall biosynthesis
MRTEEEKQLNEFADQQSGNARISVIVLAYNVGKHLETCLQSIILQTYRNLDIIVVINGKSNDCTEEISKKYARKDSRVRLVYNNKNSSTGLGRATGLKEVEGAYFTFIDGDDCLPFDSLERLVNLIESENGDIAIGSFERFERNVIPIGKPSDDTKVKIFSNVEYLSHCLLYMDYLLHGKLYKTGLYKNNPVTGAVDVAISDGVSIGDDVLLHLQLSNYASKIVYKDIVVHFYRMTPYSISNNLKYISFAGRFAAQLWIKSFFSDRDLWKQKEFYIAFKSYQYIGLYYLLSSGGLRAFKDFSVEVPELLYSKDFLIKEVNEYIRQWKIFYIVLSLFRKNKYAGHLLGKCMNYIRRIIKRYAKYRYNIFYI